MEKIWEQFELARAECNNKKTAIVSVNKQEETEHLRMAIVRDHMVKMQMARGSTHAHLIRPTYDQARSIRARLFVPHTGECTRSCTCKHLEPGQRYKNERGAVFVSEGDVYVCHESGSAHICDDLCGLATRMPHSEGYVCPLSNKVKHAVMSMTTESGAFTEDCEEAQADCMMMSESSFSRGGGRPSSTPRKAVRRKLAGTSTSAKDFSSYEAWHKANQIAYNDVLETCRLLLRPPNADEICESNLEVGERVALEQIESYKEQCKVNSVRIDVLDIMGIHSRNNVGRIYMFMNMMRGKQNLDKISRFTADMVMGVYARLSDTPYGKRNPISVKDCCVVIVYKLAEGLAAEVMEHKETGKVYAYNPIKMMKDPDSFRKVRVQFIPKIDINPIPENCIQKLKQDQTPNGASSSSSYRSGNRKRAEKRKGAKVESYKRKHECSSTMSRYQIINARINSLLTGDLTMKEILAFTVVT